MYTGYITTNNATQSKLYYTLYSFNGAENPAASINDDAPLILWLQGGPGCSVQQGDHTEIGPFQIVIDGDKVLTLPRNMTWNKKAHLLFPEDILGVGFSVVGDENITSSTQVAEYFHVFLARFYQLYPSLLKQDLYIVGESYGGHFAPAVAAKIVSNITQNQIKLAGVAIGDGLVDTIGQIGWWAQYSYAAGLIDAVTRDQYKALQNQMYMYISNDQYDLASAAMDEILGGLITEGGGFMAINFRLYEGTSELYDLSVWLANQTVKALLHVDPTAEYNGCESGVSSAFTRDLISSFAENLTYVMNYQGGAIKTLIYQGQDDMLINTPGAMSYIQRLSDWIGLPSYNSAKRVTWTAIDDPTQIYGTYKHFGSFTYATVNKAGHMVPEYQPESCFDMITRFITNNW